MYLPPRTQGHFSEIEVSSAGQAHSAARRERRWSLLDQLFQRNRGLFAHSAPERLEGNMIYRGGSNSGNQCTSVQRGLDCTTGNEEYVLVPDGNILSLAA